MLRLGAILLLAGATLAQEHRGERWQFTFKNGDRVHGRLSRIRNGKLLFRVGSGTRTVSTGLDGVKLAERAPEEAEGETPPARETSEILRMRDGTVLLGRFLRIAEGKVEFRVATIGIIRIAGNEIAEYLPTEAAVRSYYSALSPSRSGEGRRLSAAAFETIWGSLARRDANAAWRARRAILESGVHALPWLRERLRWQPDSPQRMRLLISYLDNKDVGVRQMVQAKLLELGMVSQDFLREAVRKSSSVEVRTRAQAILTRITGQRELREPIEILRVVRTIGILEEMASPEAREILTELAAGSTKARTTREAQLALDRLKLGGD